MEEGAYREAALDLRRAVGLAAGLERLELREARARALSALGDDEGAIAEYDQMLADPEGVVAFAGAYRDRAAAHCRIGEADAAAVGWQVWLSAVPGGSEHVQDMLWALGYLRGPIGAEFGAAALAGLRAWTRDGCPAA
jgi:tetratricopeptide (TPR) repeat protein